jgi:hypothetical protein
MTFATPSLLAALLLLVPVLIAFLVRRRRRVVRVPSTLLYKLAGAPVAANRRFKHIKELAALVACLCAVASLVFAAARPAGASRGETVAFVVDVSASMAAGGRDAPLEQARRFLKHAAMSGGPGDRYAIVTAGASPVRVAGPIVPGPELEEAIASLAAERGAADVDAALDLAASLVSAAPAPRVVLLTDGGESTGGVTSLRDVPVVRRTFAPPARDNLGIVAFATRPTADARDEEREALITVATSSDRPRVAKLVLTADGHEIASRRIEVPARGEAETRVRVLASIARLVARVQADDGAKDALAADDEATLAAASRAVPRVILVAKPEDDKSPAAFFAEKALASAGAKQIVHASPDLAGVEIRPDDLVVALSAGPERRVDVPALYLGTQGGALPLGGFRDLADGATHLRSVEARDPILRGVALDGITVEHAVAAEAKNGARALVDLDGGSVILAGGAGRGAWVWVGIDPAKSDLVLRVAFPVLVANAIHHLAGAADVLVADTVARTEVTLQEAKATEPQAVVEEPDPPLRLPVSPAMLLALFGAVLLAAEAWAWRKGWAS